MLNPTDDDYQVRLLMVYLQKHFTDEQIEEMVEQTPLFGPEGLRRILGEIDVEYFCRAYISDQFDRDFGEYAQEILSTLKGGVESNRKENIAIVAPRGHGKSTLSSLAMPTWSACYKKKRFVMFISANKETAANFLLKVQRALESPEITYDFGKMRGDTWNQDTIHTSSDVFVVCSGWESGLRGVNKNTRPDLIILDDLESKDTIASDSKRFKLEMAFKEEISRLGDYKTDFFYIGTLLDEEALLAKVIQQPSWKVLFYQCVTSFPEREDLWEQWREIYRDISNKNRMEDAYNFYLENKEEMLRGASVLWDGKYPEDKMEYKGAYYNVMLDREKFGEDSFWKEDQNQPVSMKAKIFPELSYYDMEAIEIEEIPYACITVDPSLANTSTSDYSGITVLGKHRNNYMYVLEGDCRRLKPDALIDAVVEKCKHHTMVSHVGFETVAFQSLLVDKLRKKMLAEGLYHIKIVEIKPKGSKENRIVNNLSIPIGNGYIKFNRCKSNRIYNEQIEMYTVKPKAKHDDAPDSLEMAYKLLTEHVVKERQQELRQRWLSSGSGGML